MNFNNPSSQILIKGITTNGKPIEFLFDTQEGNLNLEKKNLKSIDLSPLEGCDNIRVVNLQRNSLESIDLNPLQNKKELKDLLLAYNKLTTLDLSPIKTCDNLNALTLSRNELTTLDLSPIGNSENLRMLTLNKNNFTYLDVNAIMFIRPKLIVFEVDNIPLSDPSIKGEPMLTGRDKTTLILLLISFLTCVFGFLTSLYYLTRNKKKHALWYLLAGLFSAASAFLFATAGFYTGPGGPGMSIVMGIVTWIGAFIWMFVKISDLEEKK